jgi:NADH-quinone oxidoreductase subunit A
MGILVYTLFAAFLGILIVSLSYFLVTQSPETEKLSTYECGFEPYEDSRNKSNIRFYIVAILFILFDIEIIFLLPWCVSISQLNLLGFWSMIEFLVELGIGFLYVWSVGAIEWD